MKREEDLHSPDCSDATDLICGLIKELSSLKLAHLLPLSWTFFGPFIPFFSPSLLPLLVLSVELLTYVSIGQFHLCHAHLCAYWLVGVISVRLPSNFCQGHRRVKLL